MNIDIIDVDKLDVVVKKWKEDIIFAFKRPQVFNNVVRFLKNSLFLNVEFLALIEYYSPYYGGIMKEEKN